MYLFFDTETTGFPSASRPARDPKQARVCQMALILTDEKGKSYLETSFHIKPDGWSIQEGAYKVHGISNGTCERYGIESGMAYSLFFQAVRSAKIIVGHNIDFDMKMMKIEAEANGLPFPEMQTFCTMKAATDICKIPGKGDGYKWPKLSEALPVICGRQMGDDAHDAMVDTKACRDIFFSLSPFKPESYEDLV